MYKLTAHGMRWLKTLHLITACCWIGGAISLFFLHFLRFTLLQSGGELYGIDRAAHLIDMGVVVTGGALGCLLTGLCYSLFTGWGFFRHKWLMVKWVITIACIVFGTVALGPWEQNMLALSAQSGLEALNTAGYSLSRYLNFGFGFVQVVILLFIVWISTFKPWR